MKTRIAMALLPILVAADLSLSASPGSSATAVDGAAIMRAAKSASIVHQVPCRMRRYCDRRGCRQVRRCW